MTYEYLELKLSEIIPNEENPRKITTNNLEKLKKSVKDFPEMLELREIVIDENNIILGGNQRYKALKANKKKKVSVLRVSGLTPEQREAFVLKDNINYGVWDWDVLANKYDTDLLVEYGLNVWNPLAEDEMPEEVTDDPMTSKEDTGKAESGDPESKTLVIEFPLAFYDTGRALYTKAQTKGLDVPEILYTYLKKHHAAEIS